MVERLVKEIRSGLRNRCYISALTAALTLPDICGKAKYPNEKTARRYKQWLNDHVCNDQPFGLQADADTVYNLRCCLLHEGNPSIDKAKCKIKKFALMAREYSAHIVTESKCVRTDSDGTKECEYYNVDIRFLCEKICEAALTYYRSNKELFNFFNYRIINTDDETAWQFGLPEEFIKVKL